MIIRHTVTFDELIAKFPKCVQKEIEAETERLLEKVRLTEQKQKRLKMKKLKRKSFAKKCYR